MQGVHEGLRRRELQGKGIVPWRTPRQQPRQGERTENNKSTLRTVYLFFISFYENLTR